MRTSKGTVRIHEWVCDVDGKTEEHRSKASGAIPLPPGWMHVETWVERPDARATKAVADVCSAECAQQFVAKAIQIEQETIKKEAARA